MKPTLRHFAEALLRTHMTGNSNAVTVYLRVAGGRLATGHVPIPLTANVGSGQLKASNNSSVAALRTAVHPIPAALTESHGLGECWIARRSARDT
jgi:hypothetical protein